MNNKLAQRVGAITLSCALLLPVLAACSSDKETNDNKERVLRIATSMGYSDQDDYFRTQFTELYEFTHENVKVELVPTTQNTYYSGDSKEQQKPEDPMQKLAEAMKGSNPPDLIMVNYDQLPQLVNDNLLQQLDPMITKDKFNIDDFVPSVIEGLKNAGDGNLYALAPTFYSNALIYNKKFFTDAGVPFPTDEMTWDDVFNLARRITKGEGDKRVYGFGFNTYQGSEPFYDIDNYAAPLQLSKFDEKAEKMTVDSDQWENIWKTIIQLNKDKIVPQPVDYSKPRQNVGPYDYNNFISGRVAMAITDYGSINELIRANKDADKNKNFQKIDWDVVTVPTHPEAPGVGGSIYMNGVMGINKNAQNQKDAWEFLKFINGEKWAKLKSSSSYNLVSRKSYIKPKEGLDYNVSAFYKLAPVPAQFDLNKVYQEKPGIQQVFGLGQQKFQDALTGKKTVRQALKEWQTEGDVILQKLKTNPDGNSAAGMINAAAGETTTITK